MPANPTDMTRDAITQEIDTKPSASALRTMASIYPHWASACLAGAAALEQLATLEAEAKWQSIDTLPDHETALTIHACDLFPVVAFRVREVSGVVTWLSEVEGPEDDATRPGAYRALSRHPTHWKPLDWPVAHDERACGRCTPAPDTTPGDDDAR